MKLAKILGLVLPLLASTTAMAGEIIVNGGFETGNFNGWTVGHVGNSSNNMYINSSTTAPISGIATPGAKSGSYYAVSDQYGPGSQTLMQSFTTVAGANYVLSYDMFVNSYAAYDPNNQFSSVDLLASDGSVIQNFFNGAPAQSAYTNYSFDISDLVGNGTYSLRFLSLQNNNYQEQGVDNVSILETAAVPEPVSISLIGLGLLGLAFTRRASK